MAGVLEAVRESCPEGLWARGVTLARDGAVHGLSADADEIKLRVLIPGAPRTFGVSLFPKAAAWECDCDSPHDACAHAAAAVIAWSEANKRGAPLPTVGRGTGGGPGRAPATVRYLLKKVDRGVRIDRVLVRMGDEEPVKGSLKGRGAVPGLLATEADLDVEEAVGTHWGLTAPRELLPRLLSALAGVSDLRLDGAPIKARGEPVYPVAVVDDDPDDKRGFRLRLARDPAITEVLGPGLVRCGEVLRPVSSGDLSPEARLPFEKPGGVRYRADEVGKLVGEILPLLTRKKAKLDIRTTRLPTAGDWRPRIVMLTAADGERLKVVARLVYGDPPVARVERGELVLLGKTVPIRDERMEKQLKEDLGREHQIPVDLEKELFGERAVAFVDQLSKLKVTLEGEGWQRFRRLPAITPTVRTDGAKVDIDFGGADPQRVVEAWLSGERLIPLAGGYAPLPTDWLARYGHLIADLLSARQADGTVARHARLDLARLAAALDQPAPPELDALRALAGGFAGIPQAPLPADLNAELRPYQQQGVDWLSFLRIAGVGGVLADDMGLGKTLQALAILKGRTLVVAPTSVLPNWEAEARKFRPGLRVAVYHGAGRALDKNADLTLTTYGLLRLDADLLAAERWDTAILDEAQAIKNPDSQVARAAYRLNAALRLALTGTPVENRLDELWSQLHFTNPGLLGGRKDFAERYEKPIQQGESRVAERLRQRIKPFLLRRLKTEVARDLPPRTDMVLHCELSAEERKTYDAVRAATRETVLRELGQGGNVLQALEALLRLRQAACHRALVPGQSAETSAKVELLIETLDACVAEGHKALVFSQWTGLLDLVEPALRKAGIPFVRLDGSTRDRGAVVERFQSESGPPVFLISLKAGGTGLNLTAADHVFLLDPWWNPAVEEQAADRAHRIGQDKPVMVYRLVSTDTVEERILKLQDRKRAIAEAALGGGGGAAAGITRDDLMALLA